VTSDDGGAVRASLPPRDASAPSDALPANPLLAVICVVVWLAAGACAELVGIWVAIGSAAIALGLAVLVFDHAASRRALRPSARLLAIGLAAGALMSVATYLAYPLVTQLFPFIATQTAFLYAAFRVPPALVAALVLVPVIVGEELVWRGVTQAALVARFGRARGVLLAAFGYALAVAPLGSPVLVFVAFACGLVWGALREASHSLVAPLLAHLLWDLLVLVWLPLDLF
jgi:hypothetical protein